MNNDEHIRHLREDLPRIPDPDTLTRDVLARIRTEQQVAVPTGGWLDDIAALLAGWRFRAALAVSGAAMLLLFTMQLFDVAQAVSSMEERLANRRLQPGNRVQALYTAEREDFLNMQGTAADVLREIGLEPLTMNGYVAIPKANIKPMRRRLYPFALREAQRLQISGINAAELPSLLNTLRSRVFISLRFPV